MPDIVINPSVGKVDFFLIKGDQAAANTMRLTGTNTILFTGPISASSISAGGGSGFVTTSTPTLGYIPKYTSSTNIANSLIYDNATNIGIGTSSPLSRLHVSSTTSGTTLLRADGTNGTLFSVIDDLSDSLMSVNNSAGLPVFEVFADDRIVGGQYGRNDFVIINNKIGIGTNNPVYTLDIPAVAALTRVGSTLIGSWPTTTSLAMFGNSALDQTNAANYALLQSNQGITYLNAASGQSLRLRIANTDRFIIDSGGNIGIGTTSFVYGAANRGLVELYGSSESLIALRNSTGNLYIQKTSADVYINNTNSGIMSFATSNAQRMVILAGGSVSFGSASDILGSPGNIYLNGNTGTAAGPVLAFGQSDSVTGGIGHLARITGGGTSQDIFIQSQGASNSIGLNANPSGAAIYFQTQGAEKARITAAGNLGIGTSTPATKVDIYGPVSVRGTTVLTTNFDLNAGNAADIYGNIRVLRGASLSDGMFIGYGGAGGPIRFYSNSGTTEFMQIATTGNVGIGATSPSYKLDINNGSSQFALRLLGSSSDGPVIRFENTGTSGRIYHVGSTLPTSGAGGGFSIYDVTGTASRILIDTTGNVGIGTTSPTTKLQVRDGSITAGTTTSTSGTTMLVGQYTDGNLTVLGTEYSSGGPMLGYGVTPSTSSAGAFLSSTGVNVYRSAYVQDGATHRWYTGAVQTVVFGNAVSVSERMRINIDGNLGIGTSTPRQILHLNGSILLDGIQNGYEQSATRGIGYGSNSGVVSADGFSGMDIQSVNAGGNYSQNVRFWAHHYGTGTGNTPRMVIQYNGSIGIGTTAPATLLQLGTGSPTTSVFGIQFGDDTTARFYRGNAGMIKTLAALEVGSYFYTTGYVNAGSGEYYPGAYGNTFKMFVANVAQTSWINGISIIPGGNVGIGTTTPTAKLEVSGSSKNVLFNLKSPTSANILYVSGSSNIGIGTNTPSKQLTFGQSNDDALLIRRLTVSQGGPSTGTGIAWTWTSATTDTETWAAIRAIFPGNGDTHLTFSNRPPSGTTTERMRIQNDGNVGIGTTGPGSLLQVGGSGASPTATPTAIQLDNSFRNGVGGNTSLKFYLYKNSSESYGFGLNNAGGIEYHAGYSGGGAAYHGFYTDTTEKVRITAAGNVGIGTTSASRKLIVYGDSAFATNSGGLVIASYDGDTANLRPSVANGSILISDDSGALNRGTEFLNAGGMIVQSLSGFAPLEVKSNGNTLMYVTSGGNIGIGTTSPLTKLDVRGIIQGQSYPVADTGGTGGWVKLGTLTIPQNGYTCHIRAYIHAGFNALNSQDYYVDIFFKTSNANSVDANGFAGNSWYYTTGYTFSDPNPKWVANAAGVSATAYDLYLSLSAFTNRSHYIVEIVEGATWVNVGSTGQVNPGNGSSTVCVSSVGFNLPLGNVGIGTTAPGYKLDVSGTGRFTGDFYTNGNIVIARAGAYLYINGTNSDAEIVWQANGSNRWAAGMNVGDATENFNIYNYTTSTTNFTILKSNGNVGIGSTAPIAKLDVNGTANFGANVYHSIGGQKFFAGNGSTYAYMYTGGTALNFINSNDTSTLMTLLNGGNLGIGTTTPSKKLQVIGSIGKGINLYEVPIDSLGAIGTQAKRYEIARVFIDYNDWNNTGPVEIEVRESYYSDGRYKRYMFSYGYNSNNAGSLWLVEDSGRGANDFKAEVGTAVQISGDIYYVPIYIDLDYYQYVDVLVRTNRTRTSNASSPSGGVIYINEAPSGTNISSFSPDETTYISLASSKTYLGYSGNVGVGTSGPVGKFDIRPDSSWPLAEAFVVDTDGGNNPRIRLYRPDGAAGNTAYPVHIRNDSGNLNILTGNAAVLGSETVTSKFYFKSDGNLGIGTTAPTALLNIRASTPTGTTTAIAGTNLQIDSNASNYISFINTADNGTYAGLVFTDNNNGGYIVFRNYTGDVATGSDSLIYGTYQDHIFQTGTTSGVNSRNEVMRIKNSGYVGINTNNPTGRLHIVQGNSGGVAAILLSTDESTIQGPSANTQIRMGSNLVLNASNVMPFNVNASETMRIINNGNIGIGTTTPLGKLHVYGLLRVGGSANEQTGIIALGNDANAVGTYADNGIFRGGIGSLGSANYTNIGSYQGIVFNVQNAQLGSQATRMIIDVNGNVGIGTTGPGAKLDVNGDIYARSGYGVYSNIIAPYTGDLTFYTGGTEKMRILSSGGNVGIGTTSPTAKLTVSSNLFLLGINAQRQYTYYAIGSANDDFYFRSSTSFANQGANFSMNLSRLTYQSAGSGNDLTDKLVYGCVVFMIILRVVCQYT